MGVVCAEIVGTQRLHEKVQGVAGSQGNHREWLHMLTVLTVGTAQIICAVHMVARGGLTPGIAIYHAQLECYLGYLPQLGH